ncbi:hypothetical protein HEAR0484 [Herminiimonas arsenicoxydans]|uniref:Uncharacterized protein n=1 Tax=Herminiimonas arsenicoxydans TaxID=204773 RepID=A4G2F8_HERAR|nr:hypothetical protein HEAR0484 [Herminiimonas arsenicoxydans]
MVKRCFGLSPLQRRVLILMDGAKKFSALLEMIPERDLNEIVSYLVNQGFISSNSPAQTRKTDLKVPMSMPTGESMQTSAVTSAKTQHSSPVSPLPVELIQDPTKIREIKDFMISTTTTYLGLMSADMIHKIERAKEAAGLLSIAGQWHMALRESKHGNRFAGAYLDQVTNALSGQTAQAS